MAPSSTDDLRALNELIVSTLALLKQFSSSLTATNATPPTTISNPPHPLNVLSDSAKLLKAQTTKLSLLAINKPFTPSAITKVIRDLSGTCLPAMMSAVQICEQEQTTWGTMMTREVQIRVSRVFREMEHLLGEVQSIAAGNSALSGNRRDSLGSTGVVWESCDALVELNKLDIAGLAVQKATQYRDTIKDAIEELQEWREGTDLGTEGQDDDELLDEDDEGVAGDVDSIDDIFNAANSLPKDRPELRELVEAAEGTLKKVVILYSALVKRRLKTFRTAENVTDGLANVERLDEVVEKLQTVQSDVDDLASAFYDLDEEQAKSQLQTCTDRAKLACEVVRLNWEGKEDEFTAWSKRWEEAVG